MSVHSGTGPAWSVNSIGVRCAPRNQSRGNDTVWMNVPPRRCLTVVYPWKGVAMTRFLHRLAFIASVGAAAPAFSQPLGGLETWVDACDLAPDLEGLLANNALIVSTQAMEPNLDG